MMPYAKKVNLGRVGFILAGDSGGQFLNLALRFLVICLRDCSMPSLKSNA